MAKNSVPSVRSNRHVASQSRPLTGRRMTSNLHESTTGSMHSSTNEVTQSKNSTASQTSQVVEKVVVPMDRYSSISSALSSVRDQSSEYDTPGTSVVPTPAESLDRRGRTSRRSKNFNANVIPNAQSANLTRGKRKRTEEDDLEASDALLAQSLQEAEYSEDQSYPRFKRGRHRRVKDSEDEEPFSSPLPTASHISAKSLGKNSRPRAKRSLNFDVSYEGQGAAARDEQLREGKPNITEARTTLYPSLPSRAARDNARNSLEGTGVSQILDSKDSELSNNLSDVSPFASDSAFGNFEESEDSDASINGASSDSPAVVVRPAPVSAPGGTAGASRSRRHRRTLAVQRVARNRDRRSWRSGMEDRAARERAKLEKAHPEIKTMWDTLKRVPKIIPSEASQPAAITRKLKSFQLEGLNWMVRQEQSEWKGGLLGDEMGMGKTIQAVSLIMSDYPAQNPTLVVVPPVALMQWQNEIKEYTDNKLKVLVYHNTNPKVRNLSMKDLKGYDVIMISYAGLESIYRKESKGWKREDGLIKENSKIHAMRYHRLILDEAHSIKSRTTGVAKACFALKADFKWCLSGTPVQNRIGEFFSLLRFLQVKPFACYFCKKCSCSELHWQQDEAKKCSTCNHTGFDHVSIFNQELLNPITQGLDPELRKEGLQKLRLVTDRIMLRRVKRDHTASMELPPKEVIIHNEFFGEIERDFSSSIMSNTTRQFDTYVSRGVMLNNYANIFGLIMQMRQVANHPDLILKKHAQGGQNVLVCSLCDETAEEPIRSRCHHEFCRKCAKDYVRSFEREAPDCPRCHIPLAIDFDQPDIEQDEDNVKKSSIINRIKMEDWTSSTKIEMLVYDLYKLRSRKETHKSIVFSQFTSMLQLVEWRLRRAGFNTVMLDGSMSPTQRQKSIGYFMNNTDVEVFLVSLKAGGVALNLTEASSVFIVDPWWNPAAEWQSADRCHRIGQKRPCTITRLCIEDSVESRMVMLQEKKANMINGTINNDEVAMEKLTPEDMQFLFRGT